MDQKYIDFEKTIKKKVSFNFTPKYKEAVDVPGIQPRLILELAEKTVLALDWELIFKDDSTLEAQTSSSKWSANYAVTISLNHLGRMEVKSKSTGNELIDFGANSKRVKLFVFAFNDILSAYDQQSLNELQKEVERADTMSDYVVPESLPQPAMFKQPDSKIVWAGAIIFSLLVSSVIAYISYQGMYIIGLFEFGVAWLGAVVLQQLIKWSNYTDLMAITKLIAVMTGVYFVGQQVFQYLIFLSDTGYTFINFFDFMALKLEAGVTYKSLNLGTIGLLVAWGLELFLLYIFLRLNTFIKLIKYVTGRVPEEVITFTNYHFVQGKTEDEVKAELSRMGWATDLQHQMVWEAFEGIMGAQQLRRK